MSLIAASLYTSGWDLVANPTTLLLILVGVTVGLLVGAIPGLTANMSVAVLAPFTFTMNPTEAIALLTGIWLGSLYGGTIPAVLVNMPGTPADLMTTLDGYPMSRRGEAGRAIGVGVISSFCGGIVSVLILGIGGPTLAGVAREFGSIEYFAVAFLGLSVMAYVAGSSVVKGAISALLGLFVGVIGRDLLSGQARYTFDETNLLGGINFIAVIIGIFGMAEVLEQVYNRLHRRAPKMQEVTGIRSALRDIAPIKWVIGRSAVIGTFVGILPGAGATIASVISYGTQTRLSKQRDKMGTGVPEGIAASDSANNACSGGALMTMLTIGIPGDALTAILLGALIVQGVQPGPLLFENDMELVSSIFISLLIANVCLLVIGLVAARRMAKILTVPRAFLLPAVAALSVIGTYAINNNVFDVGVMLFFAVLGFVMTRVGIPKPPLVLALILGPILETNLRRSLQISDGDGGDWVQQLLTSPIGLPVFVASVLMFTLPMIGGIRHVLARRSATAPGVTDAEALDHNDTPADHVGATTTNDPTHAPEDVHE